MTYNVLETCMLAPGFSRSECASWVQAWGSILAILTAVAVAYIQHRQNRQQRSLEHATRYSEIFAGPIAIADRALAIFSKHQHYLADPQTLASTAVLNAWTAELDEVAETARHVSTLPMPTYESVKLVHDLTASVDDCRERFLFLWTLKASAKPIGQRELEAVIVHTVRVMQCKERLTAELVRSTMPD